MNGKYLLGIDIGGTKCAVLLGREDDNGEVVIVGKERFATVDGNGPAGCMERFVTLGERLMAEHGVTVDRLSGIGISCGGPLDSRRGVIMSPPNLPGWDNIPLVEYLRRSWPVERIVLQNDANAGAVAEWKYGAGRGCRNMIFLTCGTGMGSGLILDGRLYSGTNDMAGECGHMRLTEFGPVGFGKTGSFEGFCSGGGIAQLARIKALESLQMGQAPEWCRSTDELSSVTAKSVGDAAIAGDPLAIEIYRLSGHYLGRALAILVDILNPEVIVIGSVFSRAEDLLRPAMERSFQEEALHHSAAVCRVVPAALGEAIGDIASLALAAGGY